MISATSCYLIVGVLSSIIYAIYLISDKNFPMSLTICSTICTIVCTLLITGILFLVEKSYPTAAWVIAGILLLLHIISLFFGKTMITTTIGSETKTYTS